MNERHGVEALLAHENTRRRDAIAVAVDVDVVFEMLEIRGRRFERVDVSARHLCGGHQRDDSDVRPDIVHDGTLGHTSEQRSHDSELVLADLPRIKLSVDAIPTAVWKWHPNILGAGCSGDGPPVERSYHLP